MKTKVWEFIRASNGAPVEDARIHVLVYPIGGGLPVYAYIYPTLTGSVTTTDIYSLLTDANGYFEFYIDDLEESSTYGYAFTSTFKITWEKAGITSGSVDKIQIFDVTNREVDVTSTKTLKNKMISDAQGKEWQSHIDDETRDDHTQYLTADGSRELTGAWDIGSGAKIEADQISSRSSGTLKLTDDSDQGITINDGGRVDVPNINIDGGTIDGVSLGASSPCTGTFSTIDINGGTIDSAIIGATTPASATFLGVTGTTIDTTNLYADYFYPDNIVYSFGSIISTGLIGDWTCVGSFAADNIKINANTIYATNNSGISLLDNATNGIYINDGGFTTIGVSGTSHNKLTVIDHAAQLRLQFDEANYFEFFAEYDGSLILTGTGTAPMVYLAQDIDMDNNTITSIGTSGSYFTAGGDLFIHGYCSARWSYKIDGHDVLSIPGNGNTFLGIGSGFSHSSSEENILVGENAGYSINAGLHNIVIGNNAGHSLTANQSNVIIGNEAGYNVTSSNNVFIGYKAGYNTNVGSGNVFIGYKAGYDTTGMAASAGNSLYIANSEDMYPLIYGSFLTERIGLQTVEPSYTLDVHGDIRISDNNTLGFGGLHTIGASATFNWETDHLQLSMEGATIGLTTTSNSSVSSGNGTVKMCGTTARDSTGFLKVIIGGNIRYIPYFTTITG